MAFWRRKTKQTRQWVKKDPAMWQRQSVGVDCIDYWNQASEPMIADKRLTRPAEKPLTLLDDAASLPKPIRDRIQSCLTLQTQILSAADALGHEDAYLLQQMFHEYLPEVIEQFKEAAAMDRLHDIIDGQYTTAQVCDQNIAIIERRLQMMVEHRQHGENTKVLIQRNFLQEMLDGDVTVDVTDHELLVAEDEPSPLPEPDGEQQGKKLRVHIDLMQWIDDVANGDTDLFAEETGWRVSRDYKRRRTPVGFVHDETAWVDANGVKRRYFIVDIKGRGRKSVPAQYVSVDGDRDGPAFAPAFAARITRFTAEDKKFSTYADHMKNQAGL